MSVGLPSTLSDHPSLIGVIRMPKCTYIEQEVDIPNIIQDIDMTYKNIIQIVTMAYNINGVPQESTPISVDKSKITDYYPYTYYVLCDGECEPLVMQPQFLPSTFTIKSLYALSNQPIERYYPSSYKGDNTGRVYNITNTNQMMLPTSSNAGMQYLNANANTIMQARKNMVDDNVIGVVNSVANFDLTKPFSFLNSATNTISGLNNLKMNDMRNKDLICTPSTLSSFGTPSSRQAFNNNSVNVLKYTVKDSVKNKVENFVKKYGYKYNNYATIDHKTYKGYIKFITPDIDGGIDFMYLQKIISILERGIFIE